MDLTNIDQKKIFFLIPESSKGKQNLNLFHAGNHLCSVYIVIGIISNLEMI